MNRRLIRQIIGAIIIGSGILLGLYVRSKGYRLKAPRYEHWEWYNIDTVKNR